MKNVSAMTEKILQFVYAFQLVPKKSIRSLGFNYVYSGEVVNNCIKKGFLKEQKSQGENLLRITDKGTDYLESLQGFPFPKQLTLGLEKHAQGTKDRLRQVKLVWSTAMLYHLVPEIADQYLEMEEECSRKILKSTSLKSKNQTPCLEEYSERAPLPYSDTPSRIRQRIQERSEHSQNGNWYFLMREMRMLDENGLKKLSMTRAQGVLHLSTGNYAIYNSMSNRMTLSADYEQKYINYVSWLLHDNDLSLMVFAKSYKVALDTILTPKEKRSRFLLGSRLYKKQFYIPLVSGGAKQLDVYAIPHFREAAREALLDNADIARAKNFIYDGETENKTAIFIGFECELKEIQKIYDIHSTIRIHSKIIVYCFPWQSKFYHDLFGDRCELKVVSYEEFMKYLFAKQRASQASDDVTAA